MARRVSLLISDTRPSPGAASWRFCPDIWLPRLSAQACWRILPWPGSVCLGLPPWQQVVTINLLGPVIGVDTGSSLSEFGAVFSCNSFPPGW